MRRDRGLRGDLLRRQRLHGGRRLRFHGALYGSALGAGIVQQRRSVRRPGDLPGRSMRSGHASADGRRRPHDDRPLHSCRSPDAPDRPRLVQARPHGRDGHRPIRRVLRRLDRRIDPPHRPDACFHPVGSRGQPRRRADRRRPSLARRRGAGSAERGADDLRSHVHAKGRPLQPRGERGPQLHDPVRARRVPSREASCGRPRPGGRRGARRGADHEGLRGHRGLPRSARDAGRAWNANARPRRRSTSHAPGPGRDRSRRIPASIK